MRRGTVVYSVAQSVFNSTIADSRLLSELGKVLDTCAHICLAGRVQIYH